MNQYMNPIELLELDPISLNSPEALKKAKRRLKADMELAEPGEYNFNWSDVENLLYGITPEQTMAYAELVGTSTHHYLKTGNIDPYIVDNLSNAAIKLIEKPLLEKIRRAILAEFKNNKMTVAESRLMKYVDVHDAFSGVIAEIERKETAKAVNDQLIKNVNKLPDAIASSRDVFALNIRSLSVSAWNDDKDWREASRLINLAFTIETSESVFDKIAKDVAELHVISENQEAAEARAKVENNCFFCGSSNISAPVYKRMYKIISRRYGQVNYKYIDTTTPRCPSCKEEHALSESSWTYTLSITLAIVGGVVGACTETEGGILFGVITGVLLAIIIGTSIDSAKERENPKKGKPYDHLYQYPDIITLKKEGYTFVEPS